MAREVQTFVGEGPERTFQSAHVAGEVCRKLGISGLPATLRSVKTAAMTLRRIVRVSPICLILSPLGLAMAAVVPLKANLPLTPAISGYRLADAFPTIASTFATKIYSPPGDTNRLFLADKGGLTTVITNLATPTATPFLDLSGRTHAETECGLLGLVFHPGWKTNRQFFVYYSTLLPSGGTNALHQRLARFVTDPDDKNRALPDSETPLFSQLDPEASHQAGDLLFGRDGYLYVSVGDGGGAWDTYNNSQKITGGFFSGILRLDVDSRPESLSPNPHPGIGPNTYRIPADNPYVNATQFLGAPVAPESVRTEYWAVGLRNPFRMSLHPETGVLFANDTGQNRREEINRILPGANYGWIFYEGSLLWPFGAPTGVEFTPPVFEYEHEQGKVAITGGHWYVGNRYPDLHGTYVFADLGGPVGALTYGSASKPTVNWIAHLPGLVVIATDPRTGHLLLSCINDGRIYRLEHHDGEGDSPPALLSETGLFASLADLSPAPGLIPYQINHPFWSDLAVKQRWFGLLPGSQPFQFVAGGSWLSPKGAVWVKHFELETHGAPDQARRRIETRILVRNGTGVWGASYRWRPDGQEADLVSTPGLDEEIPVHAETGGPVVRSQRWRYPGREECLSCHNRKAGHVLGFSTAQLNLNDSAGNQLNRLAAAGYVTGMPAVTDHLPRLASLEDTSSGIALRARSYLDANCAYCHQPGGPTRAAWDGRINTPLPEAGIVGVTALNNLGDVYGAIPTQIVFPGKPDQSAIFRRIADLEPYHMPPLGTAVINSNAVAVVRDWITGPLAEFRQFTTWQTNHFGTAASPGSQASADPDGDGLSNEAEWLLGEAPADPQRNWQVRVKMTPGELIFTFERRPNILMQLESGNPFQGAPWNLVAVPDNRFTAPAQSETATIRVPISKTTNKYFRLRLSRL
jgi:glucose/arabinose dehydrogenase